MDIEAANLDSQCLWPQAGAVAGRAGLDGHELAELIAHHIRRCFLIAAPHHRQDAFKGRRKGLHFTTQVFVFKDTVFSCTVQNLILQFRRQFVEAIIHRKAITLQETAELAHEP